MTQVMIVILGTRRMTHEDRDLRSRGSAGELKQKDEDQQADTYFMKIPLRYVEPQAWTTKSVFLHCVDIISVGVRCGDRISIAFQVRETP